MVGIRRNSTSMRGSRSHLYRLLSALRHLRTPILGCILVAAIPSSSFLWPRRTALPAVVTFGIFQISNPRNSHSSELVGGPEKAQWPLRGGAHVRPSSSSTLIGLLCEFTTQSRRLLENTSSARTRPNTGKYPPRSSYSVGKKSAILGVWSSRHQLPTGPVGVVRKLGRFLDLG